MKGTGTALVVDDSESVRNVVARILRTIGYRVLEAATSDEALSMMTSERISLAVSDLNLEPTSGVALLEQAMRLNPQSKCILISGSLVPGQNARIPFPTLSKPFAPKALIALVEQVTREPDAADLQPGHSSLSASHG